ncbi:MAG: proteasome accessory factor PafA2 [Candidatus Nanopelagicales bacterium]|nr:proteasome accessory factor PafA2 [Candidatus Nanopelagicales bacterium]
MSVHRVMGIETEYGISVTGQPTANAIVASSQIVNAYANFALPGVRRGPRWDYNEEFPLRDARGFDMSRADADLSQLTDEDLGLANVILTNGARLYVDHAHPEYSAPEVTNPMDAVLWDRAGMLVMDKAARLATAAPGGSPILLYKNNTDNKGASYGCHENYLMPRATPFAEIVRLLIPFFITRQVFAGAGRLGIGQDGHDLRYQISQRADFFEVEVGLETTLKRPIINTRDEPHADPEFYRRLHVIVGDANLSDVATYLKMGTTSLVLAMIEDKFLEGHDFMPQHPVREIHQVSHDYSLRHRLTLEHGRKLTALEIQREFWMLATRYCDEKYGLQVDDQTRDVLDRWGLMLDRLTTNLWGCANEVDWVAKLQLLESFRTRDRLSWNSPKLQAVDLQYADIRPERGLAAKLENRGRLARLFTDDQVLAAVVEPPTDTRAYFRGECVRRYPEFIAAASWDSVVFDIPGAPSLLRVPTLEPSRGTKAHVGPLLDSCPMAHDLVAALTANGGD